MTRVPTLLNTWPFAGTAQKRTAQRFLPQRESWEVTSLGCSEKLRMLVLQMAVGGGPERVAGMGTGKEGRRPPGLLFQPEPDGVGRLETGGDSVSVPLLQDQHCKNICPQVGEVGPATHRVVRGLLLPLPLMSRKAAT